MRTVKNKEYSDWVSANAVITDWKSGNGVKHIIYFKYNVDGDEYNGYDSFNGNFPKDKVGDTVSVVWQDTNLPRFRSPPFRLRLCVYYAKFCFVGVTGSSPVTLWYDPDDATRVMRSDTKPDAGLWTYVPFIFAIPLSFFIIRRK